jgi:hypothetical protein
MSAKRRRLWRLEMPYAIKRRDKIQNFTRSRRGFDRAMKDGWLTHQPPITASGMPPDRGMPQIETPVRPSFSFSCFSK